MTSFGRLKAVWHSFNSKQKLGTVFLLALILLLPLQVLGVAPNIPYVSSYNEDAVVVPEGVSLDSAVIITYVDGFSEYVKQDKSSKFELFAKPDHRRVAVSRVDCTFTISVKSYTPTNVSVSLTSNRTIIPYRNVEVKFQTKSFSLTEDKNMEIFTVGMAHISSNDLFPLGDLTGDGARADVYWTLTVNVMAGSKTFNEVGKGKFTGYWRNSSYSDSASTDVSTKSNLIQIPKQLILEVWPNVGFTDSRTNFYLAYASYPEVSETIDLPVEVFGCGYNFTVYPDNFSNGLAMVTLKPQITGNLSFIYPSYGEYVSFSPTMVTVYDSQTNSFAVSPSTVYARQVTNLSVFVNPNLVNQTGYLKISGGGIVDFAEGSIEENMTFQILPVKEGLITLTYQAVGYADEVFQVQVLPESIQPILIATPSRITAFHTGQWGGFTTILYYSPNGYPYEVTMSSSNFEPPADMPFVRHWPYTDGSRVYGRGFTKSGMIYSLAPGWSPARGVGSKNLNLGFYPAYYNYQFDPNSGELLAIWCGYSYFSAWCWQNEKLPSTPSGWWNLADPHQFRQAFGIPEDPAQWSVDSFPTITNKLGVTYNYVPSFGFIQTDIRGEKLFNEDGSWGDAEGHRWYADGGEWVPVKQIFTGFETINVGWYSSPFLQDPYHGAVLPKRGVLKVSPAYPNSSFPVLIFIEELFIQGWNFDRSFLENQDNYVHFTMKNGVLQHSVRLKMDPIFDSINCRTGKAYPSGGQPSDPDAVGNPDIPADWRMHIGGLSPGTDPNPVGGTSGQKWLNLIPVVPIGEGLLTIGWLYIIFLVVATVLITDFDFRRIRFR